jgi:hypothetical protein
MNKCTQKRWGAHSTIGDPTAVGRMAAALHARLEKHRQENWATAGGSIIPLRYWPVTPELW